MTSTSTAARPAGTVSAGSRARRPGRFPGAAAAPLPPALRLDGEDPVLTALLRDHASAAGLTVVGVRDRGGPGAEVVADVVEASRLSARGPSRPSDAPPLVVLTRDGPSGPPPDELWSTALRCGACAVVSLPSGSGTLLGLLADLTRPRATGRLLAVTGGCGGAGASGLAARLAGAARAHGPVVLVDADPWGGGLDRLVEAPPAPGLHWDALAGFGPEDAEALRGALPAVDGIPLLTAGDGEGPDADALTRALSVLAGSDGTVVVDLGRELVPTALDLVDLLLLVVPATPHAVRTAARRLDRWDPPRGRVQLAVRRRGPLAPADVAEDLALPLALAYADGAPGDVPLLDVRRRGADRACRELLRRRAAATGDAT